MQNQFTMFRRGAVFYCEDRSTGQQKSLLTRNEAEARKIVQAKNDSVSQAVLTIGAKRFLTGRKRE
jgi:hypothetical protein